MTSIIYVDKNVLLGHRVYIIHRNPYCVCLCVYSYESTSLCTYTLLISVLKITTVAKTIVCDRDRVGDIGMVGGVGGG